MEHNAKADKIRNASRSNLEKLLAKRRANAVDNNDDIRIKKATWKGNIPLSFSQNRLWFLDQYIPNSSLYNIPVVLRLSGEVNIEKLINSLKEVIQKHEILHTLFFNDNGVGHQKVKDVYTFDCPIYKTNEDTAQIIEKTVQKPFNLSEEIPIRASIIEKNEEEKILCIALHHIAGDGWSLGLFLKELQAVYETGVSNTTAFQYADYIQWQQEFFRSEAYTKQEQYWLQLLENKTSVLNLPTDVIRPKEKKYKGAIYSIEIPENLDEQLSQFFTKTGSTKFMGMAAVYQILLAKLAQQTNFSVGYPIANRHHKEFENIMGFFSNTLVVPSAVDFSKNFLQILEEVKKGMLEAFENQDVPFEKIVEKLAPERSQTYTPLFQAAFFYQNTPLPKLSLGNAAITYVPVSNGASKFDLTLQITKLNNRTQLEFEYDTELFKESTIQNWGAYYIQMLESILNEPELPVKYISFETNKNSQNEITYFDNRPYFEQIARHAVTKPNDTAVVHRNIEYSYSELDIKSNQIAQTLLKNGVQEGDIVAIHLHKSCTMVATILGIQKIGAAYVPLDTEYPIARLKYIVGDAQVRLLINEREYQSLFPNVTQLFTDELGVEESANVEITITPEFPAYMYYTSGSSGKPKGVVVTHENVANMFSAMDAVISHNEESVWHSVTGISFDISVLEIFWSLSRGIKVVLQDTLYFSNTTENKIKPVDFSLFFFSSKFETENAYDLILKCAKYADENDFEAIWTPERHFDRFGGLFPNPAITSTAIATTTKQLKIRAGSVVLPLHHPATIAENWAMVDQISKGRVGVSFASGWHADDFILAKDNFTERHQILEENIQLVQDLWQGKEITGINGAGNSIQTKIYPLPKQSEIPIWLTAASNPKTFELAGKLEANLLTHLLGQTPEELAEKIELYRTSFAKYHSGKKGKVTLMLHTYIGEDIELVKQKVYKPFCEYLKHSYNLILKLAPELGIEKDVLNEAETETLLEYAFNRYMKTSALMGTKETCFNQVQKLSEIGVDEIAALVDFGLDDESVFEGLQYLNQLKTEWKDSVNETSYSFIQQFQKHKTTHLQSTPTLFNMLFNELQHKEVLSSLKELLIGGEKFPFNIAEKLKNEQYDSLKVRNMYGPTETTIWSGTYQLLGKENSTIPIGNPIANTHFYVLDNYLMPVPKGTIGELYIAGKSVSTGYWKRPTLTAQNFVPNPFGTIAGDRMYKTGDLVKQTETGLFEFVGRVDEQTKIRGKRIELGEIEAVIERTNTVEKAAVVLKETEKKQQLVAYVQPTPENALWITNEAENGNQKLESYTLQNGIKIYNHNSYETRLLDEEIFKDHIYVQNGIVLKENAVVFDVGANIGMFSLFCKTVSRTIKVHSFEPIPDTFEILKSNSERYSLDLQLHSVAVSDKEATVPFVFYPKISGLSGIASARGKDKKETQLILQDFVKNGSNAASSVVEDSILAPEMDTYFDAKEYECKTQTLSNILRETKVSKIDLLKIDVEGSELAVLKGIEENDWDKIDQIVVETQGIEITEEIQTLLESKGFLITTTDLFNIESTAKEDAVLVCIVYAVKPTIDRSNCITIPDTTIYPGCNLTTIQKEISEELPNWMIPNAWHILKELPRTENGKISKKKLAALEIANNTKKSYTPPSSAIEKQLAEIYKNHFEVTNISIDDDFFEIGGHSLLAIKIVHEIKTTFNVSLLLGDFLKNPTIRVLSQKIFNAQLDTINLGDLEELIDNI